MKAIIQRVSHAQVSVDGELKGKIGKGFLVLLGVEENDTEKHAEVLASKISSMRIFCDENGKMNLSLEAVNGGVLVVSNFTLCADCSHGRRPYFASAARPEKAEHLYEYFCDCIKNMGVQEVEKGVFGADMQVELLNDGPVTIPLSTDDLIKN